MEENILKLTREFEKISRKGWVKSFYAGSGGGGLTFEKLLGKPIDKLDLPDYYGIEIKTHYYLGKYPITLFHASPNGPESQEIFRLAERYGYPNAIYRTCKNLFGSLTTLQRRFMGKFYQYQIVVDYIEKRIYLCVYLRNKLIEKRSYWTFEWLKTRLYRKLKYLAFIEVDYRRVNGEAYYRYNRIKFYELRGFNEFLSLIEKGDIELKINIDTFRSGSRVGQMHDHGTEFSLASRNLSKLFREIL